MTSCMNVRRLNYVVHVHCWRKFQIEGGGMWTKHLNYSTFANTVIFLKQKGIPENNGGKVAPMPPLPFCHPCTSSLEVVHKMLLRCVAHFTVTLYSNCICAM